jgi:hypothetical protein
LLSDEIVVEIDHLFFVQCTLYGEFQPEPTEAGRNETGEGICMYTQSIFVTMLYIQPKVYLAIQVK